MTPRTGRPPLPEGSRRTELVVIRLTKDEVARFEEAAGDTAVSTWLRNLGLAAVGR